MSKPESIRVIAICVIRLDDKILVFEGYDPINKTKYYRPLGGGVIPGETTKDTIVREFREEIHCEVENLYFLGVLESIFTYEAQPKHEIVFVYDGQFSEKSSYEIRSHKIVEMGGLTFFATWQPIKSFENEQLLVPNGLLPLIENKGNEHITIVTSDSTHTSL